MKILLWVVGIAAAIFVMMMVIGMSVDSTGTDNDLKEARAACIRNPGTTAAQCSDPTYLRLIDDTKKVDDYCRNDPNPQASICK